MNHQAPVPEIHLRFQNHRHIVKPWTGICGVSFRYISLGIRVGILARQGDQLRLEGIDAFTGKGRGLDPAPLFLPGDGHIFLHILIAYSLLIRSAPSGHQQIKPSVQP